MCMVYLANLFPCISSIYRVISVWQMIDLYVVGVAQDGGDDDDGYDDVYVYHGGV
jgi:hypothetical protein